ncbi:hypothetical protein C2S52_022928 [Perilla frutescens var. hirtella]|nr:hypothetical protein C2S52_022928 [Perilla frutescens var. hirtella]
MSPIRRTDGGSLNLTGDAYITDEGIQVTTNEPDQASNGRVGRATYSEVLHLWSNASHKLADFSTHFSFVIDSFGSYEDSGDGLAFFLAPKGSTIKPWSHGSGLGLGNATSPVDSSSLETFVAVEFDTHADPVIDQPYNIGGVIVAVDPHVGIDLNNLTSVTSATWHNNISAGWLNDAWITYNSFTKMLRVDFTAHSRNVTRRDSLSYEVDLRDYLPEYVIVGFSAATRASIFEKHNIKSWNFSSTDVSSSEDIPSPSPLPQIVSNAMDNEFEKGNGPKRFSYKELVLATNDFAGELKLGEGGFGGVYKGFSKETNTYIAVKKVSEGSKQGRKEYVAEVKIISQLRHINLVQLIGWCHQREDLLLVYEFMPNGSLDSHLFKQNSVLTWEMRYRIAQGLASALLYLHEELAQYVVHRDIKSSNVMLDNNFNAKLGDFGLARLVDLDKDSHSTIPAGTFGYMAPEYPVTGKASKETDIYSFGIVLLEISCGRRPIDYKFPKKQAILMEWVWNLYGAGKLLDAADVKVDSTEFDASKIERLMVVGLWCAHTDSSLRPSMRQVVQVLNSEGPLPNLPSLNLKAVYNNPRLMTESWSSETHSGGGFSTDSSNRTTSSAGSTSDLLPK